MRVLVNTTTDIRLCNTTCVYGSLTSSLHVNATCNVTATCEICAGSWFRNSGSGSGLYNSATGQHWYSDNDDYWNVAGGTSANGIRFRDEHAGTIRGTVYANSSNEIGFLDQGSDWTYKAKNDDAHFWYTNNTTTRMTLNTSGYLMVCGCVQSPKLCATAHVSVAGSSDCCGLAIGQAYSNEGGWHTQLNMHGGSHTILRIKKGSGNSTDNACCMALWVHDNHPATIWSNGNVIIKAGGGLGM